MWAIIKNMLKYLNGDLHLFRFAWTAAFESTGRREADFRWIFRNFPIILFSLKQNKLTIYTRQTWKSSRQECYKEASCPLWEDTLVQNHWEALEKYGFLTSRQSTLVGPEWDLESIFLKRPISYKTLRRKHKGKGSWHWIWHWLSFSLKWKPFVLKGH